MRRPCSSNVVCLAVVGLAVSLWTGCRAPGAGARSDRYEDLVTLFREWREFQRPPMVNGVPDYSPAAMTAQYRALAGWRSRLAAIDFRLWPVGRQADWQIVLAEMNGLDFDHRVLRPWANNPAFYVTVFAGESDQPAREGPLAAGAVELWSYRFPLSAQDAAAIAPGIRAIPALLAHARDQLVGNQRDLWVHGVGAIRQQAADLAGLAAKLTDAQAELKTGVRLAREATDAFAAWVEAQARTKNGPSGVGRAHYTWYARHVHLLPYTWEEQVTLMERELARAHASLIAEEQRNAGLPPQDLIADADEYGRRADEAVAAYMTFLQARGQLTVLPYMEPALRARIGRFRPGPYEFFAQVDYRDPMVMRTHGFHWVDKARMANEPAPSPIRAGALLYNIFDSRTEGLATGWEEMMLRAGMFDGQPRSRELIWILLAQRAARALGDLRMHANIHSLDQAAAFAASHTPRGWLSLDGRLVRGEQHLYLQQPGYGTSYLVGKIQIEELLAERRRQRGDAFTMAGFMDEFLATGLVPMSLVAWEVTGQRPAWLR